jgi:hypothetical protein
VTVMMMTAEKLEERLLLLEHDTIALQTSFDAHENFTKIAMDKAETVMNLRLNSMNEFRDQLRDQAGTFITASAYSANQKLLESKIESLQKIVWTGIGMLLIVQIVIQVAMHYMP